MPRIFPRIRALLVLVPFAAATLAPLAPAAESLSVLLQKAIYAEETEGNLDSAIKLYEQIAAEAAPNRNVIAQAQYRLAVCYQKQGNKEQAMNLLNELVQSRADHGFAGKARDILKELGQVAAEEVTIRQIPIGIEAWGFHDVSLDGRYLAYLSKDNHADLWIYDLVTGKSWNLVPGKNDNATWTSAKFSPDTHSIAYDIAASAIAVSKVDGTERHTLITRTREKEWIEVLRWTPDGRRIIAYSSLKTEKEDTIFSVDAETGAKTEIARVPKVDTGWWALSSSGEFLAGRKKDQPHRIRVLNLKSGHEELVVMDDSEYLVGWAADDSKLLFAKTRNETLDLWAVGVQGGKRVGEPEIVWSNWGNVYPTGITRDGRIFFRTLPKKGGSTTLWVMDGFLKRELPQKYTRPGGGAVVEVAELLGSNGSLYDRQTAVAATVPSNWKIADARRPESGKGHLSIRFDLPGDATGRSWLVIWEDPQSVPTAVAWQDLRSSEDIDHWLRAVAEARAQKRTAENPSIEYISQTFSNRTVATKRALSWVGEFKRDGEPWVELGTLIHSEKSPCFVQMAAPKAKIDDTRADYAALVESVRLP